jgi:hypothetical protein
MHRDQLHRSAPRLNKRICSERESNSYLLSAAIPKTASMWELILGELSHAPHTIKLPNSHYQLRLAWLQLLLSAQK